MALLEPMFHGPTGRSSAEIHPGRPSAGLYRAHAILDLGADGFFDFRYPLVEPVVFEVSALPDLDYIPGLDVSFGGKGRMNIKSRRALSICLGDD